jgi:hypothetical protein
MSGRSSQARMVVSMQVDVKKQQIIEGGPQGGRITQHTMGSS